MKAPGRAVESAIVGIYTLLLIGAVVATLTFGREICIPIALSALLTFLLAPLVTWGERWIGRMAATILVAVLVSSGIGVVGYAVGQQFMDLTARLPDYKANIQEKMRVLQVPQEGSLTRFTRTVEELRQEMPGNAALTGLGGPATVPVRIVENKPGVRDTFQTMVGPIISVLALTGLVLLLTIFMLLNREDLRGRLIRLIGQGHIGATSHAMADAGHRVSRYLVMQLIVNVTYGVPVAVGLYFIGVPNALLWGALAIVLRFIPYVGPWIAAAAPIMLSLAVSDGWTMPLATLGLFVVLEIISNNVMEPWLYGSSTGVSSLALIVAAIFWAWLWGPIGLVLATPLTVCMVVIGRHVPRLSFLSILLSDEQPLTPHQECYHRLLRSNLTEATALVETYLASNSLTSLYDEVLIPVVVAAEADHGHDSLDADQRTTLQQGVSDLLDDLAERPALAASPIDGSQAASAAISAASAWSVLVLPVRAVRDELVAGMTAHVLGQEGFHVETVPAKLTTAEVANLVETKAPDAVFVTVVAPSAVVHARRLCARLQARKPGLKIVVGLWGITDSVAASAIEVTTSSTPAVRRDWAEAVVSLSPRATNAGAKADAEPLSAESVPPAPNLLARGLVPGGAHR